MGQEHGVALRFILKVVGRTCKDLSKEDVSSDVCFRKNFLQSTGPQPREEGTS